MILERLNKEVRQSLEKYFPSAKFDKKEKRGIILEIRAIIHEEAFIEVYANALTGKRCFSLISKGVRITGYDNYKFWHYHPPDNPEDHLPCVEPSIELIISNFKDILNATLSN